MNSDPNLEALVAELKADLPSERDSSRLRTRLAALGIVAAQGVAGSAAAAAAVTTAAGVPLTTAAASAGGIAGAAQASISAMAIKTFAIALVAGAGVTSSAWYVQNELAAAEPARQETTSAPPVASGLAGTAALRPMHEGLGVGRLESEGSHRAHEATPGAAVSAPARDERARAQERVEEAAPAAPVVGAPGPAQLERDTAANTNPARPATAATPLVAAGSTSTAAFAAPANVPAASESAAPAAMAPPERAVDATTLRAETVLLDRALSALRASDTTRAAQLLTQHRTRFPDGLLRRERERAERKLAELEAGRAAP